MGTNFYLKKEYYGADGKEYELHIGKRSAAGLYCWDCDETLIIGGKSMIHHGNTGVYDTCPRCGQKRGNENMEDTSAGLELGFSKNKKSTQRKTGVKTCSSFTWSKQPSDIAAKDIKYIWDEYGTKYTKKEFFEMITNTCPVQFFHLIGKCFS